MLARLASAAFVAAVFAGPVCAQWTAIAQDPLTWPYGDSISAPAGSQQKNMYRTFSMFANDRFNVLGGRSGSTPYSEGLKNWATDNRYSHMGLYDPVTDTWETAATQDILVYTGFVTVVDGLTIQVAGDLTGQIFVGDWVKIVPGSSPTAGAGKVDTIAFNGVFTTITVERVPAWKGWLFPPDWVSDANDKIFLNSVLGLTGLNDATGDGPPQESYGYQGFVNSMMAAYDVNGGSDELFIFDGYPHWIPNNVDVYDYDANTWSRGTGLPGDSPVDVQSPGGAQCGQYFVLHAAADQVDIYDLANDFWLQDLIIAFPSFPFAPVGAGFPNQGSSGKVYWFSGNADAGNLQTTIYEIGTGFVNFGAAPAVTANQCGIITYGNYAILFGGRTGGGAGSATNAIRIYDTLADTWCVSGVTMPYRASSPAVGIDPAGTVYLCGGLDETVTWRNDAYKIPIAAILSAGVKGVMDLDAHVAPQNVTATIEFYAPGGAVVLDSVAAPLDGSGNFTAVTTLGAGTYDVRLTAPNFLSVRIKNVVLADCGLVDLGTTLMYNGDGDGNEEIGLPDMNIILLNFGTGGPAGDYDGNGGVELADLNIDLLNFGLTGDN